MGVIGYKIDCETGEILKREFKNGKFWQGYFESEEAAKIDYEKHRPAAEERLDKIEKAVRALIKEMSFHLSYTIKGDTYGIYEEYQYISVTEGVYEFYRKLGDL